MPQMRFLPGEAKAPRFRTCLFHKPAKVQAAHREPLPSHVARSILCGEGFPDKKQTFEAETSLASPKGCEKALFSFSCQVTFVLLNAGTVPVLSGWTWLSQLSQETLPWISLENSTQARIMAFATPKGLSKEGQQQPLQRISKWVAQAWLSNLRIMAQKMQSGRRMSNQINIRIYMGIHTYREKGTEQGTKVEALWAFK